MFHCISFILQQHYRFPLFSFSCPKLATSDVDFLSAKKLTIISYFISDLEETRMDDTSKEPERLKESRVTLFATKDVFVQRLPAIERM